MSENIFNLPSGKVQNETKNVLQQIAYTLGTSIDTVKRMNTVEDLVSSVVDGDIQGVLDNELVATNIANKLNAKEAEYAPKLTEVTKQVAQNESWDRKQSLVNRKKPRPLISIIDDDSNVGFYNKFYPVAKEFNIPMTIALITSREMGGSYHTKAQLDEMVENGIEIVSHSHYHEGDLPLTAMTEEQLHDDFSRTKKILKDNGWNDEVVVYPYGADNAFVHRVVRQYFKAGIDTFDWVADESGDYNTPGFNQFALSRVAIDYDHPRAKEKMLQAVEDNAWIIFISHADQGEEWTGVSDEEAQNKLRALVQYAQSIGLEFVTIDDGLKEFGNLAQFTDLTISADGKVSSQYLEWTEYVDIGRLDHTHIENYGERRGMTRQRVRGLESEKFGLPPAHAGMIYTQRDSENVYSFQLFVSTFYNETMKIRYWDNDNNNWTNWNSVGFQNTARSGQYLNNAKVHDYPIGETTVQKVSYAQSEVFDIPIQMGVGQVAGHLHTYRGRNIEDSYQVFVATSRQFMIMRTWETRRDLWSRWHFVGGVHTASNSSIPINSTLDKYPQGEFTMTKVTGSASGTMGESGYGHLITWHDSEDPYSYQEYINIADNTRKRRTWNETTNSWNDFV